MFYNDLMNEPTYHQVSHHCTFNFESERSQN